MRGFVLKFSFVLGCLWPAKDNDENFLIFLTDRASYMLKAGVELKLFYPKLVHETCVAHALHRLAEEMNKISSCKLHHFKHKESVFEGTIPHIPLPPQPVLTLWGT